MGLEAHEEARANASTSIVINKMVSNAFLVIRGGCQGDAFSCLLYDLGIEPLATMIRALMLTLGREGVLPGGYIESLLRVFKQFTHTLPSR